MLLLELLARLSINLISVRKKKKTQTFVIKLKIKMYDVAREIS